MSGPVGFVPQGGYSHYSRNMRPTNREEYAVWFRKLQIKVRVALTNPHRDAKGRLDDAIRLMPNTE